MTIEQAREKLIDIHAEMCAYYCDSEPLGRKKCTICKAQEAFLMSNRVLQMLKVDAQKAENYRWHDLLTNPKDVPSDMNNVLVCYIGGDNNWYETMFWDADRRVFSLYSFTEFEKARKIAKDEYDFSAVIAWKYIEPFEEVLGE